MKKEMESAFKYGCAAARAGLEFAPCNDKKMSCLVNESDMTSSHRRNQENMQAWYEGYLSQTASDGNGISKEMFSKAVPVLINCKPEAIPIWINFAVECVELGQYVDFSEEHDKCKAINRWLETLLAGLLQIKAEFGEQIAGKICNLALKNECLYPYEMPLEAEDFQNNGNLPKISDLFQSGALEPASAYFPKLSNDGKNYSPNASIYGDIFGCKQDDKNIEVKNEDNKTLEENKILKLAEKIYKFTDGMCQVGPGPYGFGTSNTNLAEIGLYISFRENPVRGDTLFPDDVEGYEISVCAFHKQNQRKVSKKEISELMESENTATQKIASAFQELSKEALYITTKECTVAFKELADREFGQVYGNKSVRQAEANAEEKNVPTAETEVQMGM